MPGLWSYVALVISPAGLARSIEEFYSWDVIRPGIQLMTRRELNYSRATHLLSS